MAESMFNNEDSYTCSVCLELMKDPVTIPCGHNYCMACIKDCWDKTGLKKTSCPQCRETFVPRPVLNRNTMLAEILENLKKTLRIPPPATSSLAEPGDIECDFCIEMKSKAIRSCLECRASYCETHLQPHYNIPALQRHKLVNATNIPTCQKHDKLLEVFCRTDQKCICMLCLMDEHKGHDTVSCASEREKKQVKLEAEKKKFEDKRQEKQQELQKLQKITVSHVQLVQQAIKDTERDFNASVKLIEKRCSEVIQKIREQEKDQLNRLSDHQEQLKLEINTLLGQEDVVDKLIKTEDNVYFLQNFDNAPTPTLDEEISYQSISEFNSFKKMNKIISDFKDQLEVFCKQEGDKVLDKISCLAKEYIKAGDSVRVKSFVATPKYNWGSHVTHKSVGLVKAVTGQTLVVNFPGHQNWKGLISEMELVIEESAQDCPFKIGDKIRVKESVETPKHKWGGITHASVGVVKAIDGEDMTVDFPEYSDWKGIVSEMELSSSTDVSDSSTTNYNLRVGDKVRVKPSVQTPKLQWGGVTHKSVGIIKAITGDALTVDFPEFKGWKGVVSEMEVMTSKGTGGSIGIGDMVQVKASVNTPKYGWGKVSHESTGVVTDLKGENIIVQFPTQDRWQGLVSEMELVSTSTENNFKCGDKVRVKASVESPKYKWGSISHKSVGTVTALKLVVDFPEQSDWAGDPSEMELVS